MASTRRPAPHPSPCPQIPVYLGAPEVAQLLPPGSYIDASAFKTGAELGAFLQHLDTDDAAYAKYHEWRYRSFETYPLQVRRGEAPARPRASVRCRPRPHKCVASPAALLPTVPARGHLFGQSTRALWAQQARCVAGAVGAVPQHPRVPTRCACIASLCSGVHVVPHVLQPPGLGRAEQVGPAAFERVPTGHQALAVLPRVARLHAACKHSRRPRKLVSTAFSRQSHTSSSEKGSRSEAACRKARRLRQAHHAAKG